MRKKSLKLSFIIVLCLVVVGIVYISIDNYNSTIKNYSEKEKYIINKIENAKNLELLQSEYTNNVEYYLFTCSINKVKNLGYIAFYHTELQNKEYNDKNCIMIDYNKIYTDQPFITGRSEFDTPSRYANKTTNTITYKYFYGNVNDSNIKTIIIDFPNEALHIDVTGGYYSAVSHSEINPNYITGVDKNYKKIYAYDFKK